MHLIKGMGHYTIRLGEVTQVIIITNKTMTLGYTYTKRKLKKPLNIFCKISHISLLIAWILSRLSWTPALQGRDQSILSTSLPTVFAGKNNEDSPTVFYTSTNYMLWESGCTHYINPYFELYIEYKPLEKGDDTEVNVIGGLIKPKGVGTVVLVSGR